MLDFDFIEKGLGIVFPPHFVHDFSRKMFLVLYSINWPNFNVWLSLLLEICTSYRTVSSAIWHIFRVKFPVRFLIKFRTFWCQFHILYANESCEIINHKNKTSGTSMERFRNASHDIRNKKNMPYCTSLSAITSLSHSYQSIEDHRLWKTQKAIPFP